MSLGKITNSLAAATVENSLSLFQFNFDFTFKKTAPPIEFQPVGQALSIHRRLNAENGAVHRTARKLGWLFEQIVPDTPKLLKAYGLRVCEILRMPGVNPAGSSVDGPFREFVGVDCTSLWAAATSGLPALGVHLLACMLARAWDAQTATAIWVELVKSRQDDILEKLSQNHIVSETSVTAARQEFLRTELSNWDASARSWLAQADKALAAQRDQYLLIVKNISLSTGNNKNPYINVISAWTLAMSTMEKHLEGISQQVSDGAALYAISAWHLYPNIAYFGNGAKSITFSDSLFEKQATMTLGLNEIAATEENRGTHWSLCLSHLRFYGDPVPVESVEDRTRVTLSQFRVVVLGSVLESWRVPPDERLDAAKWICDLWNYLRRTAPFDSAIMSLVNHTSWLAVLAQAAATIVSEKGTMLKQYESYLSHGELWARQFLGKQPDSEIRPYFGLCNPMIMRALQEPLDIDAGIEYLRSVARSIGLTEDTGIICYTEIRDEKGYYEYCTVAPHLNSHKDLIHTRWIKLSSPPPELRGRKTGCHHPCHKNSVHTEDIEAVDLDFRTKMITARGEQCFQLGEGSLYTRKMFINTRAKASCLFWETPPPLFVSQDNDTTRSHHFDGIEIGAPCSCLSPQTNPLSDEQDCQTMVFFEKRAGMFVDTGEERESYFELYVRSSVDATAPSYQYDIARATRMKVDASVGSEWLKGSLPQPVRVWDYIERYGNPGIHPKLVIEESLPIPDGLDWKISHGRAANLISNHIMSKPSATWLTSLEVVGVINEIYQHMPGATISLTVLEYPILDAQWAIVSTAFNLPSLSRLTKERARGTGEILQRMGREETFACIAMMQTGTANIEPADLKEVMAISADNSIFVSSALLSDPYDIVGPRAIRHIIGNVGHSGLNLMVSPAGKLKISHPKNEVRNMTQRFKYDFSRKDFFQSSSLHLSFTGQRFPIVSTDSDNIDEGIFFLQSIVSLWNGGKHVADLNLLDVQRTELARVKLKCSCPTPSTEIQGMDIRCLDSWEDVLLPPRRMAVMRAYKNWSARLAAAAILIQQETEHSVGILPSGPLCWTCIGQFFVGADDVHWPDIMID